MFADHVGDGLGDLQGESCAIGETAAVVVGAPIGVGCQELVQEITVRGVDLHGVGAGLHSHPGRIREFPDYAFDFGLGECARHGSRLRAGRGEDVDARCDRRRRDRCVPAGGVVRMAHAAGVHELDDQIRTRLVYGVGDGTPAFDVGASVDSGSVQIALPGRGWLGALGDEQAEGGALGVVAGGHRGRGAVVEGTAAGHGRQRDPVRELHGADGGGGPEFGHGDGSLSVSEQLRRRRGGGSAGRSALACPRCRGSGRTNPRRPGIGARPGRIRHPRVPGR